jgi:hypothetical protein
MVDHWALEFSSSPVVKHGARVFRTVWRGAGNAAPTLRSLCGWFPVMPLNDAPAVQIVAVFSNEAHRNATAPSSCKISYADYDSMARR